MPAMLNKKLRPQQEFHVVVTFWNEAKSYMLKKASHQVTKSPLACSDFKGTKKKRLYRKS